MKKSCAVVGGGFKGMMAAYLLAKQGVKVTLIEKAPALGGIMLSREWNGFFVDNGVQIFDSIPQNLGEIVREVLNDKVVPIDFSYASVYKGKTTPGLAIPDLTCLSPEQQATILYEIARSLPETSAAAPESIHGILSQRYGNMAAGILDETMRHIYSISGKDVSAEAMHQTLYHRLRFLPDDIALELKKQPELDARLAAMRKVIGKVDDFVSLYPKERAMRAFCEAMEVTLQKMGVTIMTGTHVERFNINGKAESVLSNGETLVTNHVVWSNDYHQLSDVWLGKNLDEHIHRVPMVVYYFALDPELCNSYTYFHKFTPGDVVFRPSNAGRYGEQMNADGKTYISVECPGGPNSAIWKDPDAFAEKAWNECVEMGLLKEAPVPKGKDAVAFRVPVTHRFPKVSFTKEREVLDAAVEASNNVMVVPDTTAFVRRQIMWAVEASVEKIMAA